ncbi:glycoside hydrolase family 20 protein [Xylariaceae sp. FL0255]|nr:glycoside hydrolase family 20 protein [Xylariaceae sp. FL0255]
MGLSFILRLSVLAALCVTVSCRIAAIPTIPFTSSGTETFSLSAVKSIVVDSAFSDTRDQDGETLIPPTLSQFADTFAGDLSDIFGLNVGKPVVDNTPASDSIFFTLANSSNYVGASGAPTSEGYTLSVTSSGITISGASPLGAWWGTRSLAQLALLSNGKIPVGEALDAPGWSIRGMMLDAGRHYYPPEFITEMCAYLSFFKQNTFHLHLSDNLYNNVDIYSREESLSLYARFRLWSDSAAVAGLNKHKNESYTKDQFEEMQSTCVARGVTIIPELEAPGHALPIVQWKPELGLSSDLSLLNISYPDTIPTMKTIWSEFLPWFHSKTVHIGADEYTGPVAEYNLFVDEMDAFIYENSGKSTRIWGTFPPMPQYDNISTNVSIQHWEFFEDNPLFDYLDNNYTVLNSDDTFYVVNKWSGSYPQTVNVAKTFTGNPATNDFWYPNIFDTKNATNNPPRSNPLVPGEVAALWNDDGPNATVYSEAYYAWREGVPALADKQWGGNLSQAEFEAAFPVVQMKGKIPGQNLERIVPSTGSVIFSYDFKTATESSAATETPATTETSARSRSLELRSGNSGYLYSTTIKDTSGNGYDATINCTSSSSSNTSTLSIKPQCIFQTPLSSKGRNYTLSLQLRIDSFEDKNNDVTIISGGDSALTLTPPSMNLTLFASGNYYRLNTTVPLGTWVEVNVVGRGNATFGSVREIETTKTTEGLEVPLGDGRREEVQEEEFLAVLGINGEYLVWAPIAIEAPIAEIRGSSAGWAGEISGLSLRGDA